METLSLAFQVSGLIAIAVFTFLCRRKKWAPAIGIIGGFVINIVAQGVIMGGGPTLCFGIVVFPLYGWIVSTLTLKIAGLRRG